MDQLGHLLLGLALAGPLLYIVRTMIQSSRASCLPLAHHLVLRERVSPLPSCDPKAVAEYFASLLPRSKGELPEPLSPAEFAETLREPGEDSPPVRIRFDGEGGYQLRL